ncbi:MAG: hypothetical protein U5K36_15970 [Roseovarius sp.]|nr:hypothetical protein [Roseovarius sp.]
MKASSTILELAAARLEGWKADGALACAEDVYRSHRKGTVVADAAVVSRLVTYPQAPHECLILQNAGDLVKARNEAVMLYLQPVRAKHRIQRRVRPPRHIPSAFIPEEAINTRPIWSESRWPTAAIADPWCSIQLANG